MRVGFAGAVGRAGLCCREGREEGEAVGQASWPTTPPSSQRQALELRFWRGLRFFFGDQDSAGEPALRVALAQR